jgi:two-component system nitrate/nitrite response regulator NarL
VLIVDDQPAFRELARRLLIERGYSVVGEAGCGSSALEAAALLRPDAVLLDVRLGEEDGFEVARELRHACPGAAVLLVSNADYGACAESLGAAGACGFVLKGRLASADLSAYWQSA